MSKVDRLDVVNTPERATMIASPHEDWIDVMRVIAIVLIVTVHVLNPDAQLVTLAVGSVGWLEVDAVTSATRWALPVFVMITGYLLLDPRKPLDWHTYYCRRMQRIAWPLLAWTMIYFGLSIYSDHMAGRPVAVAKMARLLIKGAPYYHLWYLYMLPGLYLVCPFIKLATDRMTPGQLTGAVLLSFALTIFSSSVDGLNSAANVTYIDDFPRYLGYLLAGHLLGRVVPLPSFVTTVAALVAAFLILAGAAYIAAQVASPPRAMRLFGFGNPAVIVLSLAAFAMLRRVSVAAAWRVWLVRAGAMSFGIYLVHPAILDGVQNWMSPNSLPAFVGVVMLGLLSSALVILIMQRLPVVRRCV